MTGLRLPEPRAAIGISGWVYPPWRGVFYPEGLRQRDELRYAASKVTSIEINASFYALHKPSSWISWRDAVPEDFVFAVKAPRLITHVRRLEDVQAPLANFLASGVLALGPKLGPILWQLSPSLEYDRELVERFLGLLPHSTAAAAELARRREAWMQGRDHPRTDADRVLRHAIEPRHPSFDNEIFAQQLERHGVAAVLGDNAGRWPVLDWVTSDFAYARLHGDKELYASGYDEPALRKWEIWVRSHLSHGRDVYVYFDNDAKVRAPFDAMSLIARLRR